jgi:hypothetical protein
MHASLASPRPAAVEAAQHLRAQRPMASPRVIVHRQVRRWLVQLVPESSNSRPCQFLVMTNEPRDRRLRTLLDESCSQCAIGGAAGVSTALLPPFSPLNWARSAGTRWNRRRFVGAANRRAKQEKQTWSRRGSDTDRSDARNIRITGLKGIREKKMNNARGFNRRRDLHKEQY